MYSHPHIHMCCIVITENRIAAVKTQITICITRQPEQHACACGHMERVLPVIEGVRTRYTEKPGPAIIVDRIGHELVTRKRVIVMCVIDLEIARAHGHFFFKQKTAYEI